LAVHNIFYLSDAFISILLCDSRQQCEHFARAIVPNMPQRRLNIDFVGFFNVRKKQLPTINNGVICRLLIGLFLRK
jgi:hypothetical protein